MKKKGETLQGLHFFNTEYVHYVLCLCVCVCACVWVKGGGHLKKKKN